jgi:hypothetical protein
MVSEMQLARRQLDKELNRHNIPDALQVLDRAVGGLIDLAKSRVGDGVTNAKEVKNPFGDPPGIPGAGKADGNYRLPKFAGVYTNTQSVPKKKVKTKSESSTALPTAAGSMRLGKAADGMYEDEEKAWDEDEEKGWGNDNDNDADDSEGMTYKGPRGMGPGMSAGGGEDDDEEYDPDADDDEEGEDDGDYDDSDNEERYDEEGNPDPNGEYDKDGNKIGPSDDDEEEEEEEDEEQEGGGDASRQQALEELLSRDNKYDKGPGMRPRKPVMPPAPPPAPAGPPGMPPGAGPMAGGGAPMAQSFQRSRKARLGDIHKALVSGPDGAQVAEVVEASKELAQMVNVFGRFLADISTQVESVRQEQYESTAMLANAVSTVVKSQAAMALGLERIAKSATALAQNNAPMQKSLRQEPASRPNPGVLMNGKVMSEGAQLRRSNATVLDDSGYAMVSGSQIEGRLTKSLVGTVIQQSVLDGEYSPKEALRWLTETDSPTTGPIGVFQQLPPKLRDRIIAKTQEV